MTEAPPRSQSGPSPDQPSDGETAPYGSTPPQPDPAPPNGFDPHGYEDRQRSLLQKLLLATATLLSVVILVVTVGGYALYRHFDGQIDRIKIAIGGDRPPPAAPGTTNFLLVGSDSRAGTGNEFQRTGEVAGERSDTTILAHLDADGSTTLVSFPRDTLVRIPGHGRNKLNAAVTLGGPALLVRTVENLTDIKIDHYVSIDLAGFRDMTNAIGGVTVCVKPLPDGSDSNLYDINSQWRGTVGENHLDGDTALAFVRQRIGLPGGDFDRIRRQQQFISAVLEQATGTGVLANPAKLESLLSAATNALTVDEDTTIDDLRTLAGRLRGLAADQVRFATIPVRPPTPGEGANERGELAPWGSVQIYDPDELDHFFDPLRDRGPDGDRAGHAPGASATPPPPDSVDPADVKVDIYNAANVSGLATQVATELTAAGFDVGTTENWLRGRRTTTQIRFDPDLDADAHTLARWVHDAELVADPDLHGSVSLVLGSSFDGLADGTRTGTAPGGGTSPGGPTASGSGTASGAGPGPTPTSTSTSTSTSATAAELVAGCTY